MSPSPRTTRARRATAAFAASALAFGGSYALLGASGGTASSHREAPLILNDPGADNTDTYAFVSPDAPDTVTLIANWLPFQEPGGGPNFYPWDTNAQFNIKIDNNGDAVPDITYRWTFETQDARATVDYGQADGTFLYNNGAVNALTDATLLFKQTYDLTEISADDTETVLVDNGPVAPSHAGDASMPNYAALRDAAIVAAGEGGQSYVGQADDPFFLDLRVFDLLYGGDLSERGVDTLDGFNVNSVALQVPAADLVAGDDPVIGIWSTTDRPSIRTQDVSGTQEYSGDMVQVSRLGNPLVNEVVIPANLKDAFNALKPEQDATVQAAVDKVLFPEVPKLLEALYQLPPKAEPRTDLQAIFLTGLKGVNQPATPTPSEQLRLNTSIPPTADPNRLGVLAGDNAGFPNGRRLTDDVVDIALQAVAGAVSVDEAGAPTGVEIVAALADGDQVNENDVAFGGAFPYLALPASGSGTSSGGDGGDGGDGGGGDGGGTGGGTGGTGGTGGGSGSGGTTPSGGVDTGRALTGTGIGADGTSPLALVAGGLGLLLAGYGMSTLRRARGVRRTPNGGAVSAS